MSRRSGRVHVATTTRRYKGKVYRAHLLRRTYRKHGKVLHETVGNISHLPPDLIETIRLRLRGETAPSGTEGCEIVRSLPHGHVAAVLGTLRKSGLEDVIASRPCPERTLVVALIVARLIEPRSKLATARGLRRETATSSLALELDLDLPNERPLYTALDWLRKRQHRIENKLTRKHLRDGSLLLYDVTSSFYTGSHCGPAKFGHNREGKNGYPQIVYGLLCNGDGCPIAVEVFEGNTSDPKTLQSQVDKVRKRFHVERAVWVGDRGMLTAKRINEDLRCVKGLDWITALRPDSVKKLAEQRIIQPSLFERRDLVEIRSPDYPGERLVVCRNPFLAQERARKRRELIEAAEKKLNEIVEATKRRKRPLRGKDKIALRVGKVIDRYKVSKHFVLEFTEESFSWRPDEKKIAEEAALDGLYVIRTSVLQETLDPSSTVRAYKALSRVERAFRCMKTVDLRVRPIYHWLDDRVRAHVFLCMLAYYVEWHMREKLAPILFEDDDNRTAEAMRRSVVAPAQRSPRAKQKDATKRTEDELPVHSFRTLLDDLRTLAKNHVRVRGGEPYELLLLTQPTALQRRAFELLGVSPRA